MIKKSKKVGRPREEKDVLKTVSIRLSPSVIDIITKKYGSIKKFILKKAPQKG